MGNLCDIIFEVENGVFCKFNYCLFDVGVDKGYCGGFCEINVDCFVGGPFMVCVDRILFEWEDAMQNVSLKLC